MSRTTRMVRRGAKRPRSNPTSLSLEVVIEILSWVPTKSLFRFKSVSKAWRYLLSSDSHFITLHTRRLLIKRDNNNENQEEDNPGILLQGTRFFFAADYKSCNNTIEFKVPFRGAGTCMGYQVSGISNGMVCLCSSSRHSREVYVWNPLTGDYVTIPSPPMSVSPPTIVRCSPHLFSSYKDTNGEYKYKVIKLVCTMSFFSAFPMFQSHVSAYTLGTNTWRPLQDIPFLTSHSPASHALVNGVLYWFGKKLGADSWDSIVTLNSKTEVIQEIPHPCPTYSSEDSLSEIGGLRDSLGELGGLLCVFGTECGKDIHIWVMQKHGDPNSWTKQFIIGRPLMRGSFQFLEPLAFTDEGEIIIKKNSQRIVLYNPKTNSINDLQRLKFRAWYAYAYKGTLASPRLINGGQSSADVDETGRE